MIVLSDHLTLETYCITVTSSYINVKEIYVELQELTPLYGKLTFDTLQKMMAEGKH